LIRLWLDNVITETCACMKVADTHRCRQAGCYIHIVAPSVRSRRLAFASVSVGVAHDDCGTHAKLMR